MKSLRLPESYDLIWDVRGDYDTAEQYHYMIEQEILELNDVLSDLPGCWRICIKISTAHASSYRLPKDGRFYYLPWCFDRNVAETRYVCRYSKQLEPIHGDSVHRMHEHFELAKSTNAADCELTRLLKNDKLLFLNCMLMRFDHGDYITLSRCEETKYHLNLFSINRNCESKMYEYLNSENDRGAVVTYFSKHWLQDDETESAED